MINNIQDRLQSLSPREKIIALITLLILLWSVWDHMLYQPAKQKLKQTLQSLESAQIELKTQQQTMQHLETNKPADPNISNQQKLATLKEEYAQLQEELRLGGKQFVPPQLMATVLQDLLNQHHDLTLLKLTTLPVTTLLDAKQQDHPIYIHGLAITFSGSYLNTLTYLKSLEALPWHFKWDSMDLQVKNHPSTETTIRAYTLSFEESWLGI
ncbi:MAG: hypothetical protein ABL925_07295 [Methylococcales bacterium]